MGIEVSKVNSKPHIKSVKKLPDTRWACRSDAILYAWKYSRCTSKSSSYSTKGYLHTLLCTICINIVEHNRHLFLMAKITSFIHDYTESGSGIQAPQCDFHIWLEYSPNTDRMYCFVCRAFTHKWILPWFHLEHKLVDGRMLKVHFRNIKQVQFLSKLLCV